MTSRQAMGYFSTIQDVATRLVRDMQDFRNLATRGQMVEVFKDLTDEQVPSDFTGLTVQDFQDCLTALTQINTIIQGQPEIVKAVYKVSNL